MRRGQSHYSGTPSARDAGSLRRASLPPSSAGSRGPTPPEGPISPAWQRLGMSSGGEGKTRANSVDLYPKRTITLRDNVSIPTGKQKTLDHLAGLPICFGLTASGILFLSNVSGGLRVPRPRETLFSGVRFPGTGHTSSPSPGSRNANPNRITASLPGKTLGSSGIFTQHSSDNKTIEVNHDHFPHTSARKLLRRRY